jgi:AraC-like DNA-binding protein
MPPYEIHPLHRGSNLRVWHSREPVHGRPNAHPGIEVAWLEQGRAHYRVGSAALEVGPGDVVIVPARVEHGTVLEGCVRAGVIELAQPLIDEISAATSLAGRRLDRAQVLAGGEGVLHIARALQEESLGAGPGHALAVDGLLEALVVRLMRFAPEAGTSSAAARDPRVLAAIDLVHARLADDVSIDDMARAAGMSRFHFSRRFREATGASPYAFILRARAERAAELLRRGRRSVTEAAFESGFHDLGRFRHAFRATHGVSPADYVNAVGGGRGARRHEAAPPA